MRGSHEDSTPNQTRHAYDFPNGIVWYARQSSKSLKGIRLPHSDPSAEAVTPYPGDSLLREALIDEVRFIREEMFEYDAPRESVLQRADRLCAGIVGALEKDPAGIEGLTDILERSMDILTERPDLDFSLPEGLIVLSQLLVQLGEDDVAECILRNTGAVLDSNRASMSKSRLASAICLTFVGRALIQERRGKVLDALRIASIGWAKTPCAQPVYRRFVGEQYCSLLMRTGQIADIDHALGIVGLTREGDYQRPWVLSPSVWTTRTLGDLNQL